MTNNHNNKMIQQCKHNYSYIKIQSTQHSKAAITYQKCLIGYR